MRGASEKDVTRLAVSRRGVAHLGKGLPTCENRCVSRPPTLPSPSEAQACEVDVTPATADDAEETPQVPEGQSFEQTYHLRDRYAADLFLALTRHRGLLPYRRARQHETTVLVRASSPEHEDLWSAFRELDRALAEELTAATLGFVRAHLPASQPKPVTAAPALEPGPKWGEPYAHFDYREANQGSMIRFAELFPDANSLVLYVEDESYVVDDDWCARPNCQCLAGIIHLYRVVDEKRRDTTYAGSMHFPSDNRAPLPGKLGPLPDALRDALSTRKVTSRLEERRAVLRSAAAAHMRAPQPPAQPTKYGRNGPCPCGSGKKFKKCCLRTDDTL